MVQPVNNLNITSGGASATGLTLDTWGHPNWRVMCRILTGTPTATLTVATETSEDGTNWEEDANIVFTGSAVGLVKSMVFSGRSSRYVRARVTSHTAGTVRVNIIMNGNTDSREFAPGATS